MCGRFFLQAKLGEVGALFETSTDDAEDLGPRDEIFPTDPMLAVTSDTARHLGTMHWGMLVTGWASDPRSASPTLIRHARAETVFEKPTFRDAGRCVLPVSGWHDWAANGDAKIKLRFTAASEPILALAAVWRSGTAKDGTPVDQFAVITCGPNAEIAEVHHRMPAIIPISQIDAWLHGDKSEVSQLLRPAPDGLITIEDAAPRPPQSEQLSLF